MEKEKGGISLARNLTLGLFLAVLVVCILTGAPLLAGLCVGLAIFCAYAAWLGFSPAAIGGMLKRGVLKSATILWVFVFIGLITAGWRICGTIPFILYHAVGWIQPGAFALCAFLLCSLMSFLTGTSFGTASTMGFICMMLGRAAGLPAPLLGGAILSGVFFGDRCSPMSSSALLVATITDTDIYKNIGNMFRSAVVPFAAACLFYLLAGRQGAGAEMDASCVDAFAKNFNLSFWTAVPALLILVLACFRVKVVRTMAVSAVAACLVALLVQKTPPVQLLSTLVLGYSPADPQLADLLAGGGLASMVNVTCIIIVSSASFGIFDSTRLLDGLKEPLHRLAGRITAAGATVLASVLLGGLACNQTLAAMLVHQVCGQLFESKEEQALILENTVILLAALIPWSIAGSVPLASVGAPMSSMLYAVYLYFIPLWVWAKASFRRMRAGLKTA